MPSETPDPIATVVVGRASHAGAIPDVIVQVMSPLAIILVRMARVYLQTAVGLMTTGTLASAGLVASGVVSPELLPAVQVLGNWRVALGLAVGPALTCGAQNTLELLARLDERLPQMRP